MRYDVVQLMADIIRMAKVPAGSSYRTATTMLGIASDTLEQQMVPEILKVSGGHLMDYEDTALVAGQRRYRFPARAIRPERMQIVNSEGTLLAVLHLASGDMVDRVLAGLCPPGSADGYWCHENNHAVLVVRRSLSSGQYLRCYYRRQANRLAELGNYAGTISAVTADATSYQCTVRFPSNETLVQFVEQNLGTNTYNVDVISRLPSFESKGDEITPTSFAQATATTATVTLPASGIREAPVAGDYLVIAGYAPVVQLPTALFGPLASLTAAAILLEQGNRAQAGAMADKAFATLSTALTTVTPRSEEAETVVNDTWD